MRGSLLALTVLGAILVGAAGAPAIKEYEVVGKGLVKAGGSGDKAAEDDAIRVAVETAAKEVAGDTALSQKAAQAAKVLKQGRRYVPEFRVVDRSEAGTTVIVKVRAKVDVGALTADLRAAGVIAVEKPAIALTRVIVLPAPGKSGNPPWWAAGGP